MTRPLTDRVQTVKNLLRHTASTKLRYRSSLRQSSERTIFLSCRSASAKLMMLPVTVIRRANTYVLGNPGQLACSTSSFQVDYRAIPPSVTSVHQRMFTRQVNRHTKTKTSHLFHTSSLTARTTDKTSVLAFAVTPSSLSSSSFLFSQNHAFRRTCNHFTHTSSLCTQPEVRTVCATATRPRSATRCRETVKRKVALVVAYEGSLYHGFQRNAGVKTLSDVLEEAFHASKAISDENLGYLEKIQWQVAARTDRGVSASGNLVSAKLLFSRDELADGSAYIATTERINKNLPSHIRLLAIKHITGSFSARSCCEARWYEYLLPLSVLGGDASILSRFNALLRQYEGSHFFHNFTVGVDHTIPPRMQARRVILQSTCDEQSITLPGLAEPDGAKTEWVRIRIKGQSFMLHQIRKMVSLAILTMLQYLPENAVKRALNPTVLINVPPAPALGLFLDCCRFGWYNEKQKQSLPEPLNMCEFEDARDDFKMTQILPSIARRFSSEDALDVYFKTVEAHPVRLDKS